MHRNSERKKKKDWKKFKINFADPPTGIEPMHR